MGLKSELMKESIMFKIIFFLHFIVMKKAFYIVTTFFTIIKLKMWDISCPLNLRFNGIPVVFRFPGSKIKIGEKCRFNSCSNSNYIGVNRKCYLATLRKNAILTIGNNTGLTGTAIGCFEKIEIGHNVFIGANCTITDGDWHQIAPEERGVKKDEFGYVRANSNPVRIEDEVWIGLDSIILKGVSIGRRSVVAAGSVVTRSVPAGSIVGGNPAEIIGKV